jgi:peptidoglycan-associated lipoprotein
MKKILLSRSTAGCLVLALILLIAGCSDNPKGSPTYSGDGTSGSTDGLPGSSDNVGGGIPVAARPEGVNPDTDVDYTTLQEYTVHFAFDSSVIQGGDRPKLQKVADWLNENQGRSLFLAGHTDSRGTLEYNRGLGERRAEAVRDYLIGLGVSSSVLHTISYGQERPVANGTTEDDYGRNRRVEIGVIKKK